MKYAFVCIPYKWNEHINLHDPFFFTPGNGNSEREHVPCDMITISYLLQTNECLLMLSKDTVHLFC